MPVRASLQHLPCCLVLPLLPAAQDFQLLGWKGGREHVPRLLITLCDGAEPAAQQGASPLSPGSRGRSPLEVEFGVLGRDGARMAVRCLCMQVVGMFCNGLLSRMLLGLPEFAMRSWLG